MGPFHSYVFKNAWSYSSLPFCNHSVLCLWDVQEMEHSSSSLMSLKHHPHKAVSSFFFLIFKYLFIYFYFFNLWLCWVFVSVQGLSLFAVSGGHSSLRCASLSVSRPLFLWSTGSRRAGSVIVVHGPSCSAACGIFPDQGSNPCPLHWQADSQPLRRQGSPCQQFWV